MGRGGLRAEHGGVWKLGAFQGPQAVRYCWGVSRSTMGLGGRRSMARDDPEEVGRARITRGLHAKGL